MSHVISFTRKPTHGSVLPSYGSLTSSETNSSRKSRPTSPHMEASHESTQPVCERVKLTWCPSQQFHRENGSVVCGSMYGSLTSNGTTLSRKTHGPTWRPHMSQHNRSGTGQHSFTGKILISPLSSILPQTTIRVLCTKKWNTQFHRIFPNGNIMHDTKQRV